MLNKGSFLCLCPHVALGIYPEYSQPLVAKGRRIAVLQALNLDGYEDLGKRMGGCGKTGIELRCPDGHTKYVKMHCKLDFCPVCGKMGSMAHKRRYVRALDRLLGLGTMGFITSTLPEEISKSWLSREDLDFLERLAQRLAKRWFPAGGGVVRMHELGNKGNKPHVHINTLFIVDNETGKGMVSKDALIGYKKDWSKGVNDRFGTNYEKMNVKYKFSNKVGTRIHWVKYVFRPVATAEKVLELSDNDRHWIFSLVGWRNTRWFGNLSNVKYKKYLESKGIDPSEREDSDVGLSGVCPACGKKFKYMGTISWDELPRGQLRYVDDDVLVDFEIWEAIKDKEKYKIFDSGLSFEDIVKQYS